MKNIYKNNGVYSGKNQIDNDKYYTPLDISEYCVNKVYEIIGKENITEYIEPSAGNGSFLNFLPNNTIAYDILPEHELIKKQDYLQLNLTYKKGRLVVGNPPFGKSSILAKKFLNKSFEHSEYVAFILPIMFYENVYSVYKFDLIYSEILPDIVFSGRNGIKCCFNIYKRPIGKLNEIPYINKTLVDINQVRRQVKHSPINFKYDIALNGWGRNVGKVCDYKDQYCLIFYIKINNEDIKLDILEYLKTYNWKKRFNLSGNSSITNEKIHIILTEKFCNNNNTTHNSLRCLLK